ncbi:uncharacterized protein G2W53_009835 [Senna tora]|uniref:Uncharacterized protein n=1 Tax=Senna tora TaxID=362788 RepID=A0A835CAL4_9FABA|nr:uncharacterized protein G2W53_009835 [Senna tora]
MLRLESSWAWEERGSCLNILRMTNRGRISETFTNYEAKVLLRKSMDHVLTYSGRQITVGSQKPSRIMRQKACCARAWITSQHIPDEKSRLDIRNFHELRGKRLVAQVRQTCRLASRSGFDAPIGVLLAWEERGSCLKYSGRQITVGSQKPSRITRQKTCCASESNTWFANRVVLMLRLESSWHGSKDLLRNESNTSVSRTGVVLMLRLESSCMEERGSCHNISGRQSRSYLRNLHDYEAKDLLRKNLQRITRQKTCCASESNTSIRAVFANRSGFDAPIGVAWHGRSMDHVLTYSERQTTVGSQKPSRITRGKTCCASELNTSVRVVFANVSGFNVPIGVVLAWEERGSCLNIFRTTNRIRISETFTNYEAKDLLRNRLGMGGAWICLNIFGDKSRSDLRNLHELRGKRLVAQVSQTRPVVLYSRTGVVLMLRLESSWHARSEDHVLNIFRRQIAVDLRTFTNYEAKDLLRK